MIPQVTDILRRKNTRLFDTQSLVTDRAKLNRDGIAGLENARETEKRMQVEYKF